MEKHLRKNKVLTWNTTFTIRRKNLDKSLENLLTLQQKEVVELCPGIQQKAQRVAFDACFIYPRSHVLITTNQEGQKHF